MKTFQKTLLIALLLLGLSGCVGGYIEAESGPGYYDRYERYPGYYGHDRWYHDGPWMDSGPRGYIGIQISPPRPPNPFRRR